MAALFSLAMLAPFRFNGATSSRQHARASVVLHRVGRIVWCGELLRPPRLTPCVPGRKEIKLDCADPIVGGGGSIRPRPVCDKQLDGAYCREFVTRQFDRVASEFKTFDDTRARFDVTIGGGP